MISSRFNPPSDGFALANALTAPKSNHIVTMLPSFKAVMSEPLPFFPVGNCWRAKCDKNFIFFERPFTAPASGRVRDSVRTGTAKQQQE